MPTQNSLTREAAKQVLADTDPDDLLAWHAGEESAAAAPVAWLAQALRSTWPRRMANATRRGRLGHPEISEPVMVVPRVLLRRLAEKLGKRWSQVSTSDERAD
jgi:hypothetical protein